MATDWKALEIEYVNSAISYKELAEKHNLKDGTIRARAMRNGWAKKRNAMQRIVTETANARLTKERTDELAKFNGDDLKVAKAVRASVARLLGAGKQDAQDLRALAGAHEAAQRVGRLALGASTENSAITNMNVLDPSALREMSSNELSALRGLLKKAVK